VHVNFAHGDKTSSWTVTRRYNEFRALNTDLLQSDRRYVIPQLPPQKYLSKFSTTFLETRRMQLERYLMDSLKVEPLIVMVSVSLYNV
jgi:hypothetical protein